VRPRLGVTSARVRVQGGALHRGCTLWWREQSAAPDRTEMRGGGEAPCRVAVDVEVEGAALPR
jgi:hypothetical protein